MLLGQLRRGRSQRLRDCFGMPQPGRCLVAELRAPGCGQPIELRAPIVVRDTPLGVDPSLSLEPMKSRVERSFLDEDGRACRLINPLSDCIPMPRPPAEGLEDHEIEAAAKYVELSVGHCFPLPGKGRLSAFPLRRKGRNWELGTGNWELGTDRTNHLESAGVYFFNFLEHKNGGLAAAVPPLPATRYPLPATRYPLPATRYPLPATRKCDHASVNSSFLSCSRSCASAMMPMVSPSARR